MITPDELRAVPTFADLDEETLSWLAAHLEERRLEAGDRLFTQGDEADRMFVVLEGEITTVSEHEGRKETVLQTERGEITGLLPFSRMERWGGTGTAEEPSRVAVLHRRDFPELVGEHPELTSRLVALMSDRVRDFTRLNQQREKLMALGKLSAGLAHELNNPAAAVARTAADLRARIEALPDLVVGMVEAGLDADAAAAARALARRAEGERRERLSTVERGEREDAVADWLEARGVADAYTLAETFVDAGLTADDLEREAAGIGAEALAWVECGLAARLMLREIEAAAGRITDLVTSVKSYSHMDEAVERKPEDLHDGLDSTLAMMGYKVKRRGIQVERRYGELPPVPLFGGEMNQVWTNLLDNAFDAAGEGGTVQITTSATDTFARVDIEDDGPGIPPEIQSRIFEPFFTTKEVGRGTGLGLDMVRRIVEHRHGGQLQVESRPGCTVFSVCLPLS